MFSTGVSNKSFYPIFNKRFDHLKILLTIHTPKSVFQLGHCVGLQDPIPSLNAPKGPSYYPKSIMLQFQICYHSHLNDSQKIKTNINFRGQAQVRPPARALFYPISIMLQISSDDSGILQLTRNAKTNNNIAGHHLVSRRVIPAPSDVQGVYRCPKRTFILPQKYLKCVIKTT